MVPVEAATNTDYYCCDDHEDCKEPAATAADMKVHPTMTLVCYDEGLLRLRLELRLLLLSQRRQGHFGD